MTAHPTIISLDCETAGIAKVDWAGAPIPEQRCFHPAKLLATDGIHPLHHLLVASVTVVEDDPRRSPFDPISMSDLAALRPGETRVFELWKEGHRRMLADWLSHATVLLGMHLHYDLLFLRTRPEFRHRVLSKQLVDLSVLMFLRNETAPERSLKDLGPVLGEYSYDDALISKYKTRHERADSDSVKELCAQDTHNVILGLRALAGRILHEHPDTPKSTHEALAWYSPLLACVVRMSEAGIPFSIPALHDLESKLRTDLAAAEAACSEFGLLLHGPGSEVSRRDCLSRLARECGLYNAVTVMEGDFVGDQEVNPRLPKSSIRVVRPAPDHPLLEFTKARKSLSWGNQNRDLVAASLPAGHPALPVFEAWKKYAYSQKLLSTYTAPLLREHTTKQKNPLRSRLVRDPRRSDIGYAHATFYIVPSSVKDSAGDDGGTIQSRLSARDPAVQTLPPPVKKCCCSRFDDGVLVSADESQIELRSGCLLSGDESLMGAFQRGEDLHGRRAVSLIGEPSLLAKYPVLVSVPVDKWKSACPDFDAFERQMGKTVNFSDFFWAMGKKMQATVLKKVGILKPLSIFDEVVRARHRDRRGLVEWQLSLCERAERDGIIRLPVTGHSRYFLGFRLNRARWEEERILSQAGGRDGSNMLSEIVNFPVQCCAANLLHAVMVSVQRELDRMKLNPAPIIVNQVHDALYIDTPRKFIPEVDEALRVAHDWVATSGYWAALSAQCGRTVPIKYDRTIHENP